MLKRIVVGAAAPVLAIVIAMVITIVILLVSGNSVSGFMTTIFSAPGPRIQPRWSAITRSLSSGWMSAWMGLPIRVSRGTPVSSDTSGDAYRYDPAASCTETSARTLPASSRKRCSQGSGA